MISITLPKSAFSKSSKEQMSRHPRLVAHHAGGHTVSAHMHSRGCGQRAGIAGGGNLALNNR